MLKFAEATGNEDLEMFDGSGDTPLHSVVKNEDRASIMLKLMLEYRPDLLHRENSVGRTPYELAEDAYIAECVANSRYVADRSETSDILKRSVASFAPGAAEPQTTYSGTKDKFDICQRAMQKNPGKRTLVSLLDANEVAMRLANRHHQRQKDSESGVGDVDSDGGDADGNDTMDEVTDFWWGAALRRERGPC
jgi:hypothetical protein